MSEHILKLPDQGPGGSQTVIDSIESLVVRDTQSYQQMGALLKMAKSFMAEVDETFDPSIAQANKLHKMALTVKAKFWSPLRRVEVIAKSKLVAYDDEVALAAKRAELDRLVAEKKAIAAREAAERKAREEAEEARRQAEMALELALEAEQAGATELTEEAFQFAQLEEQKAAEASKPLPVPPPPPAHPPIPSPPPRIEGISSRRLWLWRVTDINLVPKAYWSLNETLLGSIARTQKEKAEVPGIEFYPETSISSRKGW